MYKYYTKSLAILGTLLVCLACKEPVNNLSPNGLSYRQEMKNLVKELSAEAKKSKPGFIVIVQNGLKLLVDEKNLYIDTAFVNRVDGFLIDKMHYGQNGVDTKNDSLNQRIIDGVVSNIQSSKKVVFGIDYCGFDEIVTDSRQKFNAKNAIGYITNNLALNTLSIIPIANINTSKVSTLGQVKNFAKIKNISTESQNQVIKSINESGYDMICIEATDLVFNTNAKSLVPTKTKPSKTDRLIIAVINIAEVRKEGDFWKAKGNINASWKGQEKENFTKIWIKYWDEAWKANLYKNPDSIVKKAQALGYDGVLLEGLDAHEWWE